MFSAKEAGEAGGLQWELLHCCDGDISVVQKSAASNSQRSPLSSVLASQCQAWFHSCNMQMERCGAQLKTKTH